MQSDGRCYHLLGRCMRHAVVLSACVQPPPTSCWPPCRAARRPTVHNLVPVPCTQLVLRDCGVEGRGLVASRALPKGEALLQLPESLLLTAEVAARGGLLGGCRVAGRALPGYAVRVACWQGTGGGARCPSSLAGPGRALHLRGARPGPTTRAHQTGAQPPAPLLPSPYHTTLPPLHHTHTDARMRSAHHHHTHARAHAQKNAESCAAPLLERLPSGLPEWSVLALYLAELRGRAVAGDASSRWAPYVAMLPQRPGTVLEWGGREVGRWVGRGPGGALWRGRGREGGRLQARAGCDGQRQVRWGK